MVGSRTKKTEVCPGLSGKRPPSLLLLVCFTFGRDFHMIYLYRSNGFEKGQKPEDGADDIS